MLESGKINNTVSSPPTFSFWDFRRIVFMFVCCCCRARVGGTSSSHLLHSDYQQCAAGGMGNVPSQLDQHWQQFRRGEGLGSGVPGALRGRTHDPHLSPPDSRAPASPPENKPAEAKAMPPAAAAPSVEQAAAAGMLPPGAAADLKGDVVGGGSAAASAAAASKPKKAPHEKKREPEEGGKRGKVALLRQAFQGASEGIRDPASLAAAFALSTACTIFSDESGALSLLFPREPQPSRSAQAAMDSFALTAAKCSVLIMTLRISGTPLDDEARASAAACHRLAAAGALVVLARLCAGGRWRLCQQHAATCN